MRESLVLADESGRIVFVMPHDRYVLVGTTDTDFTGDPATVRTEITDVEYLLAVLAESLPGIKLTNADVATSFAGLRALIREDKEAPSSVPREEVILESLSGLITVAGGKFTTHRAIAQKLVDQVMKRLGRAAGICPTLTTPFPGARPLDAGDGSGSGAAMRSIPSSRRKFSKLVTEPARRLSRGSLPGGPNLQSRCRGTVPRLAPRSSTPSAARWRIRSATF